MYVCARYGLATHPFLYSCVLFLRMVIWVVLTTIQQCPLLFGHEEGLRGHEDERIAAILERIQAIKPEYKQR